MLPFSFNGATALLVTEAPDWQAGVKVTLSLDRNVESSLSNREARRPYSAVPRVTELRYQTWVTSVAARQLIRGTRSATSVAVLMPFWPAQDVWANRASASIGGGLMIAWKSDWSGYSLYIPGAEPTWPLPGDNWAPCLQGHFPDALKLDWQTDDLPRWEVSFMENGPFAYALALATQSWTAGPAPSAAYGGMGQPAAPDLVPFKPDWSDPVGESFTVKIIRERTGFRHSQATTFYSQAIARLNEASYLLTSAAMVGQFARFWMDHAAAAAIWMPNGASIARLTADVASSSSSISIDSSAALIAGDWLAIYDSSGALTTTQVSSTGAGTAGVTPSIGPIAAAGSAVQALLLARLDQPTLEIEWTNTGLASAKLGFREAPPEYSPDGSETLGSTLGALAARAILFEFTPLEGTTSYWTNYEQSVSYGGHTYVSADFAHGDIRESLNLERTDVELTSQVFSGHPWLPLLNLTTESPVGVVIRWATVSGSTGSGAATMFTGQLTEVNIKGQALTAKATPGGERFSQDLPRLTQSPICWATLFFDGCNLVEADWKYTATAASPISSAYPYALNIASLTGVGSSAAAALTAAAVFASWFAGGYVEWTPTGSSITQRRAILGSTSITSGALTLTLDRWWTGSPSLGDTITLYPGCDQLWTTCGAYNASVADTLGRFGPTGKFNNQVNFRGAPFRPPANPTVVQRAATNTGGKKP